MRFLTQLLSTLRERFTRKVCAAETSAVSPPSPLPAVLPDFHELRSEARYPFGVETDLVLGAEANLQCVVVDACGNGLGLFMRESLPPGTQAAITVHFNGYYLRKNLRVVWSDRRTACWAVGAEFLPGEADTLTSSFMRFLRWKSANRAAA